MKLGLIARMDTGGLANQTWEQYKWFKPAKTLVVDISNHNGYPQFPERFADDPNVMFSPDFPTNGMIDEFLNDLDIVLTTETPYNYYLFTEARARGIKTVLQYNYEFLDYLQSPHFPKPDLLLAPSSWHVGDVNAWVNHTNMHTGTNMGHQYIDVPVNRQLFPFTQRTQAKTFMHVAGHLTYEDRNGTQVVLDAIPLVQSDVQFIIRSQYPLPQFEHDYRVKVITKDTVNYWENFTGEDVLLLPRKYGGLSLQLAEAMSTGMLPLITDLPPQNGFVNKDLLLPVEFDKNIRTRTTIPVYTTTAQQLAEKIDWLASQPEEYIKAASNWSDMYAGTISWETLLPKYIEAFEQCLRK